MADELNELQSLIHEEIMDLDRQNEKMRAEGLPIISTSIDATVGASVTTFKEFQLAEIAEISKMTPQQIQQRIRNFKFEQWSLAQKMMTDFAYLNDMASKMSKEARAALKITDLTYNPKELSEPKGLRGKHTELEKQIADLKKLLPNMTDADIQEMIRKGKGSAFQKGLTVGNGSPEAIDTCSECGVDYSGPHDCPVVAEKKAKLLAAKSLPVTESPKKELTLAERLAKLRATTNKEN